MAALKDMKDFAEGVQVEMRRVTWPDQEQLRNATLVVLVFVVILGLVIGLMDWVFSGFVQLIVGAFSG